MPAPAKNRPPPAHLSTVIGEVLKLEGAINLANMPRLLSETEAYASQQTLPDCLTVDFDHVTDVDSSAVALLLHWRRRALASGRALRYVHLPENLSALAELYGVTELIHCPKGGASQACPE
ncbi:MAG: STAS domain-containing protein [Betaproteobacteria bacterium]|nr:STAS domain-containing protein [Betaproteobacteria bacterium]